jgi:glycosyltransferase involved in cell wall biosynthesis
VTGRRLAVLVSLSGEGGVERMVLNLVRAFAAVPGLAVDLVLLREESRHLQDLPANVNVVRLGVRHSALGVPALVRYLTAARPDALLAAKDRAGRAALLARRLAGVPTRVVIRLGTTLSEAMKDRHPVLRWLRYRPIRRLYRWADAIVAVSEGVADDVAATSRMPRERIHVIRNPVVTPDLFRQAQEPADHPWLADPAVPVVMGMGRLTRQKDFPTLVRAFARLRRERSLRLVILGEGRDAAVLREIAAAEGIGGDVALPGFRANPYAWLARSRLFVLSSAWEGSPNALTEAMALGVPVVSTDCRSGPGELLAGGRYGPLVPVGDVDRLAAAMREGLDCPVPPAVLRHAVSEYTVETSARRYLEVLGLAQAPAGAGAGAETP